MFNHLSAVFFHVSFIATPFLLVFLTSFLSSSGKAVAGPTK